VAADFAMGGAAAVVAKTGAAPVERVKLLLQNQGELLRRGHLTRPYKGIANAFTRVLREEGVVAFWRGNQASVIRYFPTQVWHTVLFLYLIMRGIDWMSAKLDKLSRMKKSFVRPQLITTPARQLSG
jgi:hypothetical protein